MTRTDTRRLLLDAAIPLVARGGLKALSHRAVEDAAGVARGSARYHLGSRHEIVEGLMERMGALELQTLQEQQYRLAMEYLATGVIDIEGALRSTFAMVFANRDQLLARYWLTLEAARDESLQPIVRHWRESFTGAAVPLLTRLGARDPAGTAADLVDLVDGIVFAQMCTGRHEGMLDRVVASAALLIRERIGQTGD